MKELKRIVKRFFNKLGFTLTELICAVALMGIVAGIAVPVIGASRKSRDQREYKNSCLYVLGEAQAVCDAINNGARSLSGVVVASPTGPEANMGSIQTYLDRINSMSHQFKISVKKIKDDCMKVQGSENSFVEVVIKNVNSAPPVKDLDKNNNTAMADKITVTNPRSVTWIYYYDKNKGYVYEYNVAEEQGRLLDAYFK